jgi:hypothetical protein
MATVDLAPDPGQSGDRARTLAAGAAGVLRFRPTLPGPATITPMRHHLFRVSLPLALTAALALGGCQASTGSTPGPTADAPAATTPASSGSTGATRSLPPGPTLTPVPGGRSAQPEPLPTRTGTAQADWGEILVALPDTFPLYPDAGIVDVPEVVSGSLSAPVDRDGATAWYVQALSAAGYAVELSTPLEDGTQVLDAFSDLPECRIQMRFRPEGETTIITVLYGSGCAGLGG